MKMSSLTALAASFLTMSLAQAGGPMAGIQKMDCGAKMGVVMQVASDNSVRGAGSLKIDANNSIQLKLKGDKVTYSGGIISYELVAQDVKDAKNEFLLILRAGKDQSTVTPVTDMVAGTPIVLTCK